MMNRICNSLFFFLALVTQIWLLRKTPVPPVVSFGPLEDLVKRGRKKPVPPDFATKPFTSSLAFTDHELFCFPGKTGAPFLPKP